MRKYMQRGVVVMGLLAAGAVLPGCIVGEIRDDLKSANARLGTVDQNLASTSEKLGVVEQNLAETNSKLASVNEQLTGVGGALEVTNSSLTTLDERVRLLASIEKSMVKLDGHLASLRGTIARIDSTIPFLDLGGDAPMETPAAPGAGDASDSSPKSEAADASTGEAGQQPSGAAGKGAAMAVAGDAAASTLGAAGTPRDAWVGPWVSADPRCTYTLVLMGDGQYVREKSYKSGAPGAEVEATRVDLGTWKRAGSGEKLELVLTPRDGTKDAAGKSVASRLGVLHQTSRTLTLSGGEGPRVLRKP